MDEDERMDQIAALVAKWRATRAYDDLSESRLMGLAAIVVSGSTPREWGAGDTIPVEVTTVEGRGGIEWVRDPDPGAGVWTTNSPISDEELVSLFGPVREISASEGHRKVESGRDALVAACTALEWATDVLMHISVKLGVNDAKKCRSAAVRCDRALTGLIGTAKESPS